MVMGGLYIVILGYWWLYMVIHGYRRPGNKSTARLYRRLQNCILIFELYVQL